MNKKIIEKISNILKDEIKKEIEDMVDIEEQNAEIHDYLGRYMPYIDKKDSCHDIKIIRKGDTIDIYFSVHKENYLISIKK